MWNDFKAFLMRGNVLDLATAVVIGAAFGKIVNSFVEDIIMPPIGLALGRMDFSSLFYVLDSSKGIPASLADAKTKGIPVIAYGQFVNDVIGFLIVALAVFLMVKQVNRLKREAPPPASTSKDCPYCATAIPIKARRCPNCTSEVGVAAVV